MCFCNEPNVNKPMAILYQSLCCSLCTAISTSDALPNRILILYVYLIICVLENHILGLYGSWRDLNTLLLLLLDTDWHTLTRPGPTKNTYTHTQDIPLKAIFSISAPVRSVSKTNTAIQMRSCTNFPDMMYPYERHDLATAHIRAQRSRHTEPIDHWTRHQSTAILVSAVQAACVDRGTSSDGIGLLRA